MHDISNVSGKLLSPSLNAIVRGADVVDDFDKSIKGIYGDPDLELNQSILRLADDIVDFVKIRLNLNPDLARRPISQDYFRPISHDYFRLQSLRYPRITNILRSNILRNVRTNTTRNQFYTRSLQ